MDRDKIVSTARGYLNTPYRHQGRSIAGMDCIGLVIRVGEDCGYKISHSEYAYEQIPNPSVLWAGMNANFKPVKTPQKGDILVFRIFKEPQHMAIFIDDNRIIHAYENIGKVSEHNFTPAWRKRLLAVYSYE